MALSLATNNNKPIKLREEDKRELEQALQKAQDSDDPSTIQMAQSVRKMVENVQQGDLSILPLEARQSLEKIKALQEQAKQLEERELAPAADKVNRASLTYFSATGIGTIAAGGLAAYLTSGMSWLPLIAISGASAVGGFLAGHLTTGGALKTSRAEGEKIFARFRNLHAQADQEKALFEANLPQYKRHMASALETDVTVSTNYADKVRSNPATPLTTAITALKTYAAQERQQKLSIFAESGVTNKALYEAYNIPTVHEESVTPHEMETAKQLLKKLQWTFDPSKSIDDERGQQGIWQATLSLGNGQKDIPQGVYAALNQIVAAIAYTQGKTVDPLVPSMVRFQAEGDGTMEIWSNAFGDKSFMPNVQAALETAPTIGR